MSLSLSDVLKIVTLIAGLFGLYMALENRIDAVERHLDRIELQIGIETDGET